DALGPHHLLEHGPVQSMQDQAVTGIREQLQTAVPVHRVGDIDQKRVRDGVAGGVDQRRDHRFGVVARGARVTQPKVGDPVGVHVLGCPLQLGERGDRGARGVRMRVRDLQQEGLVALDDERAVGHPSRLRALRPDPGGSPGVRLPVPGRMSARPQPWRGSGSRLPLRRSYIPSWNSTRKGIEIRMPITTELATAEMTAAISHTRMVVPRWDEASPKLSFTAARGEAPRIAAGIAYIVITVRMSPGTYSRRDPISTMIPTSSAVRMTRTGPAIVWPNRGRPPSSTTAPERAAPDCHTKVSTTATRADARMIPYNSSRGPTGISSLVPSHWSAPAKV